MTFYAKETFCLQDAVPKIFADISRCVDHHVSDAKTNVTKYNTDLLEAAQEGDLEAATRAVEDGASPDAVCRWCHASACHAASVGGDVGVMRFLLQRGASADVVDVEGRTPLHVAVALGHDACVDLLLLHAPQLVSMGAVAVHKGTRIPKEKVDSSQHDHENLRVKMPPVSRGATPLHVASQYIRVSTVAVLLSHGASVSSSDDDGLTPLDVVGEMLSDETDRLVDVYNALVAAAARPTLSCHRPRTSALHIAVRLATKPGPAFRALRKAGAEATLLDAAGKTPASLAVSLRRLRSLEALVHEFPEAVDAKDAHGNTPLLACVSERWLPGVRVLLEYDADVCATTNFGETALHLASSLGSEEIISELLSLEEVKERGLLEKRTNYLETPLFRAVHSRMSSVVVQLLVAGAAMDTFLPGDVSVFHRAAVRNLPDILKELLAAAAHLPHLKDLRNTKMGMSALHHAASIGAVECVKVPIRNSLISSEMQSSQITKQQVLLKNGCDPLLKIAGSNHDGWTALHLAAFGNHADVAKLLLESHNDILEMRNDAGESALHVAAQGGCRETAGLLLRNGADVVPALQLLMRCTPRPTELLAETLDHAVATNGRSIDDHACTVFVDYQLLCPKTKSGRQMKVLETLLLSGQRHGQHSLLLHPVVQSFIHLKWKKLLVTYYIFLAVFGLFVASYSMLVALKYYLPALNMEPNEKAVVICRILTYVTLGIFYSQEGLQLARGPRLYLRGSEVFLKWLCFVFSCVSASVDSESPGARLITTAAVLLTWTVLMCLLSRIPGYGSYVLMFYKVAGNVIKVLLTFIFLMIGFSFAFMVHFKGQAPFDTPLLAMLKSLVIMMGEFEYSQLFPEPSDAAGRILFTIFIIVVNLALMNLLVGLAVSDINNLEKRGLLQQLRNQVNYVTLLELAVLEIVRYMPNWFMDVVKNGILVKKDFKIYPGRAGKRKLPNRIQDALLEKAVQNDKKSVPEIALNDVNSELKGIKDDLISHGSDILSQLQSISDKLDEQCKRIDELEKTIQGKHRESNRIRQSF